MLEAIIDTGSEVSLIQQGVVRELGLDCNLGKNIPQLYGISGQKLRVLGHTTTTIMVGNNDPLTARLVIVPDHYLQTAVLLGMNILGQITLTLDHTAGRLIWNNITYPLKYQEHHYGKVKCIMSEITPRDPSKPYNYNYIRLPSQYKLRPYTTTMLELPVEEPVHTVLLINPKHANTQRGLPIITTVTSNKTIFFPVINNTKQHIKLLPGILLAQYEVVNDTEIENPSEAGCLKTTIGDSIGPNNDVIVGNLSRQEKLQQILDNRDWTHLTPNQKEELFKIVLAHDPVFIVDKGELGLLQTTPAQINIKNPQPCRSPTYRFL